MMITVLAITIMAGTAFLVLANLRLVAQDTLQALRDAAVNARQTGRLLPNTAFTALWLMIFALCYF